MNEALRKTALFTRDLLAYDESLIKIGREGDDIEDFATGYIAIDTLGASQRLAEGETYDGVAEEMAYAIQWQAPVTLSFYGDGAWQRASDYATLLRSQKALELQKTLGIAVHKASGLTDVGIITGQQHGERYELTVNVQYSTGVDVDTLRIDSAQIELRTETGLEIEP